MNLEGRIQEYIDKCLSYCQDYGQYPGDVIQAKQILEIVADHLAGVQLGLFE